MLDCTSYGAGCLAVHAQTQFPPLFLAWPGVVARLRTTGPETNGPVACLLPSATMGQLRQLLLVYTTGHRDHSAQLFEISYKSANNALMY